MAFSVNQQLKRVLANADAYGLSALAPPRTKEGEEESLLVPFLTGGFTGIFTSAALCPSDVIKCKVTVVWLAVVWGFVWCGCVGGWGSERRIHAWDGDFKVHPGPSQQVICDQSMLKRKQQTSTHDARQVQVSRATLKSGEHAMDAKEMLRHVLKTQVGVCRIR